MALMARHAFGALENVDAAISNGTIDQFDILFVKDADGKPYVGWIDKEGNKVICDNSATTVVEGDSLPATGESGKIYIFKDEAYVWNGTEFKNITNSADLTALEEAIASKVDESTVDEMITKATLSDMAYEIFSKPTGTLVNYTEEEIRVMCPADTAWALQNVGENGDSSKYYIGLKAYAPDGAVSFKEDLAKTISDEQMYYFVDNEFAGTDSYGRNYSIVWLPVAAYNSESDTWTYYGINSNAEKYIGWYYSVEWYDSDGAIIASDCIRINLANEGCYASAEPYYVSNAVSVAKAYTDEQISNAFGVEVVEF